MLKLIGKKIFTILRSKNSFILTFSLALIMRVSIVFGPCFARQYSLSSLICNHVAGEGN